MTVPITYHLKYLIRRKLIVIFFFWMSSLSVWAHIPSHKFSIKNVVIYGESNILDFQLKYEDFEAEGLDVKHKQIVLENDEIQNLLELKVDKFYSPNRRIVEDFRKMLRSDINPIIRIQFDENFCESKKKVEDQIFDVLIRIGGVERKVKVKCSAKNKQVGTQMFLGKSVIFLSDFGLVPPSHIFGLIRVKESIMITFEVQVLKNE